MDAEPQRRTLRRACRRGQPDAGAARAPQRRSRGQVQRRGGRCRGPALCRGQGRLCKPHGRPRAAALGSVQLLFSRVRHARVWDGIRHNDRLSRLGVACAREVQRSAEPASRRGCPRHRSRAAARAQPRRDADARRARLRPGRHAGARTAVTPAPDSRAARARGGGAGRAAGACPGSLPGSGGCGGARRGVPRAAALSRRRLVLRRPADGTVWFGRQAVGCGAAVHARAAGRGGGRCMDGEKPRWRRLLLLFAHSSAQGAIRGFRARCRPGDGAPPSEPVPARLGQPPCGV